MNEMKVNRRNRRKVPPVANYLQGPPPLACFSLLQCAKKLEKSTETLDCYRAHHLGNDSNRPQMNITDRNTKRHSRSPPSPPTSNTFSARFSAAKPKMTPRRCLFALLHPHDEQRRLAKQRGAPACIAARLSTTRGAPRRSPIRLIV